MSVTEQEVLSRTFCCEEKSQVTNKLKLAMASFYEFENGDNQVDAKCKTSERLHSSNVNSTSVFWSSKHDDSTVWTKSKGSYETDECKVDEEWQEFHINLINLKPLSQKEVPKNENGFSDDDLQSMMSKRVSGIFL